MFDSVRRLWQEALPHGARAVVRGVADEHSAEDAAAFAPLPARAYPRIGPRRLYFSPPLARALRRDAPRADLLSLHGLWAHPALATHLAARRAGTPCIIHPEGMLEPWAMGHSRRAKALMGALFQWRALQSAAAIRAISRGEAASIRALGIRAPIALVPNGVDFQQFAGPPPSLDIEDFLPQAAGRRRLLFLSRLHPKKGIEPLLHAWARLPPALRTEWLLIVAGPQELGHGDAMRGVAAHLGLSSSVAFPGPLYGDQKRAAYSSAHAFVLPSHSETLGLVVMEAAAAGLPVLITPGCNFPEIVEAGGGVLAEPHPAPLARALQELLALGDEERAAMGAHGRAHVRANHDWATAGARIADLARWASGNGPEPSFLLP